MLKGWRTIAWNGVNAIILAMDAANMEYEIPEEWKTTWLAVYFIGNVVLRLVTTGPVGVKQ